MRRQPRRIRILVFLTVCAIIVVAVTTYCEWGRASVPSQDSSEVLSEGNSVEADHAILKRGDRFMGYERFIAIVCSTVMTLGGFAGLVILITAWARGWFRTLKSYKEVAEAARGLLPRLEGMVVGVSGFMNKINGIMPSVLEGFENKKIVPRGTLAEWARASSQEDHHIGSPRQLTETGEKLLRESGLKQFIDQNLDRFLAQLEEANPATIQDVEQECFYLLKQMDDTAAATRLKNYAYLREKNVCDIVFAGGVYLQTKYLERHPEVAPEQLS